MWKIKKIYYRNIYGVMATLAIHLIFIGILLVSQIRASKKMMEETVYIDFSMELAKIPEKLSEEEKNKLNQSSQSSQSRQGELASNRAVNDASRDASASRDPFFDKAYEAEIAAAKQLIGNVNKTLAQKIPKIGDIAMPEDNTEGKTREEVKQSNFKGKSNIHYFLENRYHLRLPIPVYLAEGGGEVTVDIVVERDGRVIEANPRPNTAISDMTIMAYAKQAAEKTVFNSDPSAPQRQKGTITYLFVPQ
jgi:hypothetical protein